MNALRQTYKIKKENKDYKRKGKCLRCGRCCNFRYLFNDLPFAIKFIFFLSNPKSLYLLIAGKDCPHLIRMGGYSMCKIYKNRPWFCKAYPETPSDLIKDCGFRFKKIK